MSKNLVLLLCVSLLGAAIARAETLPDACGDDSVRFQVATQKDQPAPSLPAAGKAQIVFVERFQQNEGLCIECAVTTRVGVDGNWVGANHGNSYFAVDIAPGEHHLCVDWQSAMGRMRQKAALDSFTAQSGKVYYYRIGVRIKQYATGDGFAPAVDRTLTLKPLSDDEGRYFVKISAQSAARSKND
jgi:hypothetical protein